MLIVLSMTMATQYATTKVSYTFGIVHPSNADIRFIGSDNSSSDSLRVLRVNTNTSTNRVILISLGDWMPNSVKNYTAAFAIVNEEAFSVNITHINISGTAASYIDIWLHANRTTDAFSETAAAKVKVVNAGSALLGASSCAWRLGAGNGDPVNMNGTKILTPWDDTSHVRYNQTTGSGAFANDYAINNSRDFVWVQISINIPSNAADAATATGQIWIHFKATTHS